MFNALCVLLVGCVFAFAQSDPVGTQLAQSAVASIPPVKGTTPGTWSGGALLLVESAKSAAPSFRTIDSRGREIDTFTFSLPGAGLVNVYSDRFARGFDGSLAVVGSAFSNDSQGIAFLAWVSPGRQEQTVVRLSPFLPRAVTVAPDGVIWTVGVEPGDNSDYPIIRRFDRTGKLLGTAVPKGSLKVADTGRFTDPTDYSYMASAKDRVGWYSEAAGVFISFALDGGELSRSPIPPPPDSRIHGLAMCEDGRAFLGVQLFDLSRNWGALAIDITGRTTLIRSDQKGHLLGCDGTSLVVQTNASSVAWLRPVLQ
jgi:hypothetical protein